MNRWFYLRYRRPARNKKGSKFTKLLPIIWSKVWRLVIKDDLEWTKCVFSKYLLIIANSNAQVTPHFPPVVRIKSKFVRSSMYTLCKTLGRITLMLWFVDIEFFLHYTRSLSNHRWCNFSTFLLLKNKVYGILLVVMSTVVHVNEN